MIWKDNIDLKKRYSEVELKYNIITVANYLTVKTHIKKKFNSDTLTEYKSCVYTML